MRFDLPEHDLALLDEDGFVRVQPNPMGSLDTNGNQKGTANAYEALLPFGMMVRPKDPTNKQGTNLLLMEHGPEKRVFIAHDRRWMGILPDFGDGGVALYATTEQGGTKRTPFIGFFGEGGAKSEGTFSIEVPTTPGMASIEISPSTGDITITHPAGTKVILKADGVYLGDDAGASPLMRYTEFAAAWATLTSNAAAIGLTVPPLAGVDTTKVKGK